MTKFRTKRFEFSCTTLFAATQSDIYRKIKIALACRLSPPYHHSCFLHLCLLFMLRQMLRTVTPPQSSNVATHFTAFRAHMKASGWIKELNDAFVRELHMLKHFNIFNSKKKKAQLLVARIDVESTDILSSLPSPSFPSPNFLVGILCFGYLLKTRDMLHS